MLEAHKFLFTGVTCWHNYFVHYFRNHTELMIAFWLYDIDIQLRVRRLAQYVIKKPSDGLHFCSGKTQRTLIEIYSDSF